MPGLDQAALLFEGAAYQELRPESGASTVAASPRGRPLLRLGVLARSTRWGTQDVGRALVSATSSWAAFRWGTVQVAPLPQTTLPLPAVFDAAAPTPHPVGLVGLNRAARAGEGSEFSTIRPFQVGDRLRRIHWPVSLRTRTLHVASTWADQDALVMLLVDASTDLGTSEGIDGFASSLDVTVRAAGAVAEHFLRHGERVGLCVFGPDLTRLAPAAGQGHLRKLLYRLADTKVGNKASAEGKLLRLRLGADAMVVMLSACVSQLALRQAAMLVRTGDLRDRRRHAASRNISAGSTTLHSPSPGGSVAWSATPRSASWPAPGCRSSPGTAPERPRPGASRPGPARQRPARWCADERRGPPPEG